MMKVKTFAIIILVATNILLLVVNNAIANRNDKLNDQCQSYEFEKKHFFNEVQGLKMLNNLWYNDSITDIMLKTIDNDSLLLSEIVKNKDEYLIVFRFVPEVCPPCLADNLFLLKKLATEIGNQKIIVLTKYDNLKDLKILVKEFGLLFRCYNYTKNWLPNESQILKHQGGITFLVKDKIMYPRFITSDEMENSIYYSKLSKACTEKYDF